MRADTLLRDVTQGRIADVITDQAKRASCDLIVMGTHGRRGFNRLTMGSEAEMVVRIRSVPVLLVRLEEPKSCAGASPQGVRTRTLRPSARAAGG